MEDTPAAQPTAERVQKRLLILFPSPLRGGAEEYCLTMAKGALAAGWEVHAGFAPREGNATLIDDFGAAGAHYHPIDVVDVGAKATRVPFLKCYTRTLRLVRDVRPDYVLLQLCGVQYGLGPILAAATLNVPTGIVFQLVRGGVQLGAFQRGLRALARRRRVKFVAVSEENRATLAGIMAMPQGDIAMVPNGTDRARFTRSEGERLRLRARLRAELCVPEDTILLLSVGRLAHQKGHDLLVPVVPDIVRRYPKVRFVWVGEGPLRAKLEEQLTQAGARDHVLLLGHRTDVPDVLNAADLFVHPTRWEGQPFSVLEAMAARLPVVTTSVSGIRDVLEHRTNALLSEGEAVEPLRENLLFALEAPDTMQTLADRAFERLEDFTEQAMIEKTLRLLEELGNGTGGMKP